MTEYALQTHVLTIGNMWSVISAGSVGAAVYIPLYLFMMGVKSILPANRPASGNADFVKKVMMSE